MDDYEISENFAEMWRRSRYDAGRSQDWIAKELGVSKKTVQNWEAGISSPSQIMGFRWFQALGLPALPYYLGLLYPEEFKDIRPTDDESRINAALIRFVGENGMRTKRQLLYMCYGDHGSSISGLLELITAYLQLPLACRAAIATTIAASYELAGLDVDSGHISPDASLLRRAIDAAMAAAKEDKQSYGVIK